MTMLNISATASRVLNLIMLEYQCTLSQALNILLNTEYEPSPRPIRSPIINHKTRVAKKGIDWPWAKPWMSMIFPATSTQSLQSAIVEVLTHNLLTIKEGKDTYGVAPILAKANENNTPETRDGRGLRKSTG